MRRKKIAIVLATIMANLALAVGLATPAMAQGNVVRLGGADRYGTMEKIVNEGFASSEWAVIATGDNYPDALAASALAGIRGCPVVLTQGSRLSVQAKSQLERLGVTHVYIMGGHAAVSPETESDIVAMGISAERVAGADRAATSTEAMKATRAAGSLSDTVIVATGTGFADSLSVGPWAYRTMSPVVLTGSDGRLSDAAVQAVRSDPALKNVVIVGGTSAVSADVESQLGEGYAYKRIAGTDRYDTSSQVAAWAAQGGLSWAKPAVSTGSDFPDALSGAALCGRNGSPLLLTSDSSPKAVDALADNASSVEVCYVLGGEAAVSKAKSDSLANALDTGAGNASSSGWSESAGSGPRGGSGSSTGGNGNASSSDEVLASLAGASQDPNSVDTDGDSYPDWVEEAYMGTNPSVPDAPSSIDNRVVYAEGVDSAESEGLKVVAFSDPDADLGKQGDVVLTLAGSYTPDEGQVFVAGPQDACPTGAAIKVASARDNGDGTVTLVGTKPDVSEVFEYMHVNEELVPDWDHIVAAEGVSIEVVEDEPLTGQSEGDFSLDLANQPGVKKTLKVTIGPWKDEYLKEIAESSGQSLVDTDEQREAFGENALCGNATVTIDHATLEMEGRPSLRFDTTPFWATWDEGVRLEAGRWVKAGLEFTRVKPHVEGDAEFAVVYSQKSGTEESFFAKGDNKRDEKTLGKVPLCGALGEGIYLKLSAVFEVSGSISMSVSLDFEADADYKKGEKLDFGFKPTNMSTKGQMKVEAKVGIPLKIAAEALSMEVLTLGAEPGMTCAASITTRTNPTMVCTDAGSWFYTDIYIELLHGVKWLEPKLTKALYNENNSPLRESFHWDDLTYVGGAENCTWKAKHDALNLPSGGSDSTASKADIVASGKWGTCPWEIDKDGLLTVHPGKGVDTNGRSPWSKWCSSVKSVKFVSEGGKRVIAPRDVSRLFGTAEGPEGKYALHFSNLGVVDFSGFDTSSVTNMSHMFERCIALSTIKHKGWDTSSVTDMSYMFDFCLSLINLDLTSWNTRSLVKAANMFLHCRDLETLNVSNWDTSKLEDAGWMFDECNHLKSLDVSKWNTRSLKTARAMFGGCLSLKSIDLSGWNVKSVTDMCGMFDDCLSLASIDLSGWKTSSLKDVGSMFDDCHALASVNLSGWDTSSLKDMRLMFCRCDSLTSVDLSGWDTSSVTHMDGLFGGCSSLRTVDLSGFDTSSVTDMVGVEKMTASYSEGYTGMFGGCGAMSSVKVGSKFVIKSAGMFPDTTSGNKKWWSTKDHAWYTKEEIVKNRSGIADTYTASQS